MKPQRLFIALTAINLSLLLLLLIKLAPIEAQGATSVLRGTALEIVDDEGRVRASIDILPATMGPDGKASSETVLLRLINADGQPSTKIGTSPTSAGLSFVGGDDQSYVILQADGAKTSMKMVEQGDKERIITP